VGRRFRSPGDEVPRAYPRASRRRGLGEDSTARTTAARRFCDTPPEYRRQQLPNAVRCAVRGSPGAATAAAGGAGSFDTPDPSVISSAGRERAYALTGARRVCVPLGVGLSARGGTERISHSPDDEADLPAQEAPSREGARISRPDANLRRPSRDRSPAGSRSEAADGLTNDRGQNPPRLVMLSRPQDFAALQGSGTSRSHPLFSARFLRTDLESTRFGLSTGRKLGGAVVRNRVRRRLREVLRAMAPSFQPGWDVLIIARPAIVESDHEALVGALRRLLQRGGVLGGPTAT
jgi:ribonuclease P protein component